MLGVGGACERCVIEKEWLRNGSALLSREEGVTRQLQLPEVSIVHLHVTSNFGSYLEEENAAEFCSITQQLTCASFFFYHFCRSDSGKLLHEGWAVKESGTALFGRTNWRKRWFRLVQHTEFITLEYYRLVA